MKKLFIVLALGSVAFASADRYYSSYGPPSYDEDDYQDQPSYDIHVEHMPQGSYDRNFRQDPQNPYAQQAPRGQQYPQKQPAYEIHVERMPQGSYDRNFRQDQQNPNAQQSARGQQYSPNQPYYQNQDDRPYARDQQRDDDRPNRPRGDNEQRSAHNQDYALNSFDREINQKIRDELGSGWFTKGYETIVIRTTNGAVVIRGTVDKTEDIQKIRDKIKDIDGIRSINTQLNVKNR